MSILAPTLGFASNLSHTIIREAREDDQHSVKSNHTMSTNISITDEELALLGPPWAKEGMLCRKQYWECTGKRAKSKAWMDVFVVIQKGELSMFIFGDHGAGGGGVVGGGNWLVSLAQPHDGGSLTTPFIPGKRPACWDRSTCTLISSCVATSRLQQAATPLHGAHSFQRRSILLPGRYGRAG